MICVSQCVFNLDDQGSGKLKSDARLKRTDRHAKLHAHPLARSHTLSHLICSYLSLLIISHFSTHQLAPYTDPVGWLHRQRRVPVHRIVTQSSQLWCEQQLSRRLPLRSRQLCFFFGFHLWFKVSKNGNSCLLLLGNGMFSFRHQSHFVVLHLCIPFNWFLTHRPATICAAVLCNDGNNYVSHQRNWEKRFVQHKPHF